MHWCIVTAVAKLRGGNWDNAYHKKSFRLKTISKDIATVLVIVKCY